MKKFINIFIAFILVIALTACRQTEVSSSQPNSADQAQVSREMSKISDEENKESLQNKRHSNE